MTASDDTIRSHGLTRHPSPPVIRDHLHRVADLIGAQGKQAITMAGVLASRGYPSRTLGDGGASNGASIVVDGERIPATGVEVAALHHDRYTDADARLARLLRLIWRTGLDIEQLVADVLAHADDVDEIPAGTGSCDACDHMCNPRRNPNDRIRAGLCHPCYKHYMRSGLDRGEWLLARRQMLGRAEGAAALAQRFHAALSTPTTGER